MGNVVITALQLATSVARLAAFAFAVLTIGQLPGDPGLLLVIGYLPYLAFFDTLIQSSSRAIFLRGGRPSARVVRLRLGYAIAALLLIAGIFAFGLASPAIRAALVVTAWPLGAIGFVWERLMAQRSRQLLLAVTELALLSCSTGLYLLGLVSWIVLLLCIVSFPVARLLVLALPVRGSAPAEDATAGNIADIAEIEDSPAAIGGWRIGRYIGTSLAQQLIAASAASLPAIYAQASGDWRNLSVNVAVFRSLHSLAAVVSLTINAMSSRIFYRQTGAGFEAFEMRVLAFSRTILGSAIALTGIAAVVALALPHLPAAYSFTILPIMAMVNAESSMLYNRGLPSGTMHCQILILLLSLSFLFVLVGHQIAVLVALAAFVGYVLAVIPTVLRSHRSVLAPGAAA